MSTKRDPLLSERLHDVTTSLDGNVAEWVTDDLLGIHDDLVNIEAARAKDAELIQRLVDGLHAVSTLADRDADERSTVARPFLEAAAAAGFKPSEQ